MPPKTYAYWEWRSDKGHYKPFGKDESMVLEKQYRVYCSHKGGCGEGGGAAAAPSNIPTGCNISTVQIDIAGQSYTFDVDAKTQTNDSTGHVRAIARVPPPKNHHGSGGGATNAAAAASSPSKAPASSTAPAAATATAAAAASSSSSSSNNGHYAWQWLSHDTFVDYSPAISVKIENAFLQDALVLDVGAVDVNAHDTANVKVHFGYMHQENKDTGVTRRIRRVHRSGPAPSLFSKPPVVEPFNVNFAARKLGDSDSGKADEDADDDGEKTADKVGQKRARSPPSGAGSA